MATNYITTGKVDITDLSKLTIISFAHSHLYSLSIILALILMLILVSYFAYRYQRRALQLASVNPIPLSSSQERQNRKQMLERVRSFWINDILEQSLYRSVLLTLGLQERPDLVSNPWRLALQESKLSARLLPSSTHITQVYDQVGGELLILGEPGSGKTTLLLELTRDLLERAQKDDSHPMPVVFNLSSWAVKKLSLADWLIEELNIKYQVPRKLGQLWVNEEKILPLLDGLDEVTPNAFTACVDAINTFRQEHMVRIVVCSRTAQYLAQTTQLLLSNAVVVQPLTIEQIDTYLPSSDEQLMGVRKSIHEDMDLQELATTPLMLSVLKQAYYGKSVEGFHAEGYPEIQQRQIFTDYVQRVLQRRSINMHYTSAQTEYWLTWLAQQMMRHSQIEFYLERMQPDWLPKDQLYQLCYGAAVRLCIGLISGIVCGITLGLVGRIFDLGGPAIGPVGGLIFGLVVGLTNRVGPEIKPAEVLVWSWVSIWQSLVKSKSLKSGMLIGLIMMIVAGLTIDLTQGLFMGIVIGLISGLFSEFSHEMRNKHNFVVSDRSRPFSAHNIVLVGLVFGLIFWLIAVPIIGFVLGLSYWLIDKQIITFFFGLMNGLAFGLIGGLVFGLTSGLITKLSRDLLNRHSTFVGLLSGLIIGLVSGLIIGLFSDMFIGLASTLIIGLVLGLIGMLAGNLASRVLAKYDTSSKLVYGLLAGLTSGLIFGSIIGLINGLINGLIFGSIIGLISGLIGGLISGLISGLTNQGWLELKFTVAFGWFWKSMWKRMVKIQALRNALVVGLVIGLTSGLAFGPIRGLAGGLAVGLISGLIFVFIGGLTSGLSSEMLDKHTLTRPNQGIWYSARNSIFVGLLFGLVGGLLFGLVGGLLSGSGLFFGLIGGTISGITAGLLSGGTAFIQHFVLRLLLWFAGYMPLNFSRFLDYAAERILLRKVGGRYIFVHQLLLDYFASQGITSIPREGLVKSKNGES